MSEPRCTEATATVGINGKVQIVKFEYDEHYFFSMGRTYAIPEDWTEEDVQKFQSDKANELRDVIDEDFATPAVDRLMKMRDEY